MLFDQLSKLGPLEIRVLKALWKRGEAATVKDLQADFPDIAYTTLMTTLDRLHRKGLLGRLVMGRAFAYSTLVSASQLEAGAAAHVLRSMGGSDAETVFSFLLDELGARDEETLATLERLVRERRRLIKEQS